MALSVKDFAQLKKLMMLATSDNDHEALASIRAVNGILSSVALDWPIFLERKLGNFAGKIVPWRNFMVFEGNEPKPMAGCYQFINMMTGDPYYGASKNILARSKKHHYGGSPKKLRDAIREYGASNFLLVPLCYSISGDDWINGVETELIFENGSIKTGYNVTERYGNGPYGEEFADVMRRARARPEVKAVHARAWKDPDLLKKVSEQRSKISNDPDVKRKWRFTFESNGWHWITDGKNNKLNKNTDPVPDGWRQGRTTKIEFDNSSPKRWITNGTINKRVLLEEPIPDGWRQGRIFYWLGDR